MLTTSPFANNKLTCKSAEDCSGKGSLVRMCGAVCDDASVTALMRGSSNDTGKPLGQPHAS